MDTDNIIYWTEKLKEEYKFDKIIVVCSEVLYAQPTLILPRPLYDEWVKRMELEKTPPKNDNKT